VLERLEGRVRLIASLLYDSGLRLLECRGGRGVRSPLDALAPGGWPSGLRGAHLQSGQRIAFNARVTDAPLYRDASAAIDERVRDLLARMTTDEKLAQLGGVWTTSLLEGGAFSIARAKQELRLGTGHVTRLAGASLLTPRECAELANSIQRFLVQETRLGIPTLVHEESCAGFSARGATQFPQAIGLASTWNPALLEEMTRVIRAQMRAVGAHQALAPVLDLARDPRWGRTEETFGEDPYLVARLGVAYVRGLQGTDLRDGIAATGKHFIGYGASEGGMNWAPAHLGRRELLERYALPFEAAIREAGLATMMNAYHEIDGQPCGASREILDELLRDVLGFQGTVVSDYYTVQTLLTYHRIVSDKAEAARRALEAGIDVELPALDCMGEPLREALAAGRCDPALVDRAVARTLRLKFSLGLFERPFVEADAAPAVFDTPPQRALARRLAQQSIVLLQNRGTLLPLDPAIRRLAVIGPSAESVRLLQGDYHYPTHLEIMFKGVDLSDCCVPHVSVLDGIRRAVSPTTEILVARGCDTTGTATVGFSEATAVARSADAAILVLGGRSGLVDGCTSGESIDRAELGLPGVQEALVRAVAATGTPLVVVVIDGRPLALPGIAELAAALVLAWLPGEEGGAAVADVLFGAVSPSGRLPVSLPRAVGQLPVFYGHKPSGGRSHWRGAYVDLPTQPLFPFGHGLSYTRFDYGALTLAQTRLPASGVLETSIEVANAGERPGDEVVQLYLHDLVGSSTRPVAQLAGFERVTLAAGETRRVSFRVDLGQLAFYDPQMALVVEPGAVEVMVGASSQDIRARETFEITGPRRVLRRDEIRPTQVSVR